MLESANAGSATVASFDTNSMKVCSSAAQNTKSDNVLNVELYARQYDLSPITSLRGTTPTRSEIAPLRSRLLVTPPPRIGDFAEGPDREIGRGCPGASCLEVAAAQPGIRLGQRQPKNRGLSAEASSSAS